MRELQLLRVLIDRIPYAEGNIGEEAILAALLQDLEACGVKQIGVFSNMPQRTRQRHGDNIQVIPDRAGRRLLAPFDVSQADLLIWGGGHMLQDRSSRLYIPYVIKNLLLAKLLGISRFIYSPGMGPVLTRSGKILSRWALQGSRRITVRDLTTARFVEGLDANLAYQRTADPVFSLVIPLAGQTQKSFGNPPIIGFAPRKHFYRCGSWLPVRWQAGVRQPNPRFEAFLQEAAAALDFLIEKYSAKVRLIPMDIGPNPRDDLVCHRLRQYMVHGESAEVLDDDPPLEEFVRRLGELDLLISARLHGLLLGMRFGLPFVGIDSDGKVERFAQSIGHGDYAVNDVDCRRESLCLLAERALSEAASLRVDLQRQFILLRDRAQENRMALRRCLEDVAASH